MASPLVTTMPAMAPQATTNNCRLRRCCSRRRSESKPTPRSPAISFSLALDFPSFPGRASAAMGSVRTSVNTPSEPIRYRSAGGKHSSSARPGMSVAFGSPPTIRQKIRSSRPSLLKASISSLTQCDLAEAGEQMMIWDLDFCSASFSSAPRSVALGSSSRSRNTGVRRFGTSPRAVWVPTNCLGGR